MKSRKKIAILGGGITGVTLAKELSTNPLFKIDLIERTSSRINMFAISKSVRKEA